MRWAAWIETGLLPLVGGVVENRYLKAIRDAFIAFALPLIISGSVFLLIAFPPVPEGASWEPLRAWAAWAAHWRPVLMVPFQLSFGLIGLAIAFGMAHNLSESYGLDAIRTGLVAMVAFLITAVPFGTGATGVRGIAEIPLGQVLENLGGQGLFVAILVGAATVEVHRLIRRSGFVIRLPDGVPPRVARTFEALTPALVVITAAWLLEFWISSSFEVRILDPATLEYSLRPATLPTLVMQGLQPLVRAADSYLSALLQILLMMLLWSMGIHGMNIVSAVAYPFWTQNLAENVVAAAAGEALPNIVTEPFYHVFSHLGGSGATLPLVFMLLRSRSQQLRQVGRVALLPGIFNINEPVTFGVPIAFNPLMIIPFVLAPAIVVTINYLVMSTGLVPPPLAQIPFTVPMPLGGVLANGSWTGGALQIVDLAVAGVIYWPFFRAWEAMVLSREPKGA